MKPALLLFVGLAAGAGFGYLAGTSTGKTQPTDAECVKIVHQFIRSNAAKPDSVAIPEAHVGPAKLVRAKYRADTPSGRTENEQRAFVVFQEQVVIVHPPVIPLDLPPRVDVPTQENLKTDQAELINIINLLKAENEKVREMIGLLQEKCRRYELLAIPPTG